MPIPSRSRKRAYRIPQKTSSELKGLVEGSMVKLTCRHRWMPSIRKC